MALQKPLCVIPARGGSKRIPRKNVRDFCGKPMIAYTIEAALHSGVFDEVYVSTDDEEIADISRAFGARVPGLRPAHLATDKSRIVDVCLYMADAIRDCEQSQKILGVLLPTSPLRTAEDVSGAYAAFAGKAPDFVVGVTQYLHPPWQALEESGAFLKPFFGDEICNRKSQEVPPLWVDTGAIYFARTEALRVEKTFFGKKTVGYPIPFERSMDIDDDFQWELAEMMMRRRQSKVTSG